MSNLNNIAPNYLRAQQQWPDARTLAAHYESLASCFDGNQHGLVENVKSFIESVCHTIIEDFGLERPAKQNLTTQDLLKPVFDLKRGNAGTSDRRVLKVFSEFNKLTGLLAEVRNNTGPVAHGKDGFFDDLSKDHTRAFLHVGDAVLGVLLSTIEGKEPNLKLTRQPYENFPHFNDRIDQSVNMEVNIVDDEDTGTSIVSVLMRSKGDPIELRVEPSRLLFGVDREAYLELLQAAKSPVVEVHDTFEDLENLGNDIVEDLEVTAPPFKPEVVKKETAGGPPTRQVYKYSGFLDTLRNDVVELLKEVLLNKQIVRETNIVDVLLGTAEMNMNIDWQVRESLQARMRVALKRVLVDFGVKDNTNQELATRMVVLFCDKAPA